MSYKGMTGTIGSANSFTISKAIFFGIFFTVLSLMFIDCPMIINAFLDDPVVVINKYYTSDWIFLYGQVGIIVLYYFIILSSFHDKRVYRYCFVISYSIGLIISLIAYLLYILYLTLGYIDLSISSFYEILGAYKQVYLANRLSIYGNIGIFIFLLLEFLISPKADKVKKSQKQDDVFGGAKEASLDNLKDHNLLVPKKLERITPENKYICYGELNNRLIGSEIPKNTCVFSKPGGGKGVTSVIPKMLDCPYPIVATDLKFEIGMMSIDHRDHVFGKKAFIIDPFNESLKYDAFRWSKKQTLYIDMNINGDVDIDIYVSTLANAIAPKDATGKNGSFYDDAQTILEGVIYYLVANKLNITQVFDLVVKKGLWFTKNKIEEFNESLEEKSSAIYLASGKIKQLHEKGNLTKYGADVAGILVNGIKLFGQSSLRNMFEKGDPERTLKIDEYLAGKADIYIVVPPNMVEQSAPFIKLVLGLVKSALEFANPQQLKAGYYPILLDEVAQLGYMKIIEQMYEVLRYKGIILWLYFQDMSQLKVFAKAPMFKSFDVLQFFEVNGDENIRFIKDLAGTKTIEVESVGERQKDKDKSTNTSLSRTELLPTDKIRELPADKQIIFYTGCPVIICDRTKYYEHRRYKGLAAKNLTRTELAHLIPSDNDQVKAKVLAERKENLKHQAENKHKKDNSQKEIKSYFRKLVKEEKNKAEPEILIEKNDKYYADFNQIIDLIQENIKDVTDCDIQVEKLMNKEFFILTEFEDGNLIEINVKTIKKHNKGKTL